MQSKKRRNGVFILLWVAAFALVNYPIGALASVKIDPHRLHQAAAGQALFVLPVNRRQTVGAMVSLQPPAATWAGIGTAFVVHNRVVPFSYPFSCSDLYHAADKKKADNPSLMGYPRTNALAFHPWKGRSSTKRPSLQTRRHKAALPKGRPKDDAIRTQVQQENPPNNGMRTLFLVLIICE